MADCEIEEQPVSIPDESLEFSPVDPIKSPLPATTVFTFMRRLWRFVCSYFPGLIDSRSRKIRMWNKMIVILYFVATFFDPLYFHFIYVKKNLMRFDMNWPMTTKLLIFSSFLDFIFFLNVLLQFRVAYVPKPEFVRDGHLVWGPFKIALNYLRSYFISDTLSALPFPLMELYFVPKYNDESHSKKRFVFRAIICQLYFRLYKLFEMVYARTPSLHLFKSGWSALIVNLLLLMLSGHVVGSLWYIFGVLRVTKCLGVVCTNSYLECDIFVDFEKAIYNLNHSWIRNVDVIACLNSTSTNYGIFEKAVQLTMETMENRYLYSLFWGLQQISSLGSNLSPSTSGWEVIFVIFIILIGLLMFAMIIGNIQNFLQGLGKRRLEMHLRGCEVER